MLNAVRDNPQHFVPSATAPWASNGLREVGQAFRGPERRHLTGLATRWLTMMLDEIDYGMLLVSDGAKVLHANHAARAELAAGHALQLIGQELRARHPTDLARLHDAVSGAQRGLRKLLTLGEAGQRHCLAVIPLGALGALDMGPPCATLLMMGKRQVCEQLSVQCFARGQGLTPTETRVLEALCAGMDPREVAEQHGVGLATVRSQIGSIRGKTGADSIKDLVRQVSVLPPMVSSLRAAA